MKRLIVAGAAALALASCGGSSSDTTAQAATCLKNALENQALDPSNTNCGDATAAKVGDGGSGTRITVSCTRQNGNQYICQVKVPQSDGINLTGIHGGFYSVTFDGKSIVYQPTQ